MRKGIYVFFISAVFLTHIGCVKSPDEGTIIGTYHNIGSDTDMTIEETLSWGGLEYELKELNISKRGRFDRSYYKMTVFKDMRPDHFSHYLMFSEDYKFAYSVETGNLKYVKSYYYDSLTAEEKEVLKSKIIN